MLIQVGELAKRAGITVRTLHHYEQTGLLTPSARSAAGYRLYNRARSEGSREGKECGDSGKHERRPKSSQK